MALATTSWVSVFTCGVGKIATKTISIVSAIETTDDIIFQAALNAGGAVAAGEEIVYRSVAAGAEEEKTGVYLVAGQQLWVKAEVGAMLAYSVYGPEEDA